MSDKFLVYGAYGYTGRLVVRYALEQGLHPVLAGRNREPLAAMAREANLEYRVFALDDPAAVRAGLAGCRAVAHCAGPFSRTALPMASACLESGTHYLDITGEIEVFERLAAKDKQACGAGVMLLPGSGFDVVPSDCLALHLKNSLPGATHLRLAFVSNGRTSHGTATTVVENLHRGLVVRRNGVLTPVPSGWKRWTVDFGRGPMRTVTIPWGDVSTAFYSTGIPNIEVYMAAPAAARAFTVAARYLGPVLGSGIVQRYLKRRIDAAPSGPSDEMRARSYCLLYGEVEDGQGGRAEARLETPDGYTVTAHSVLAILRRVLAGDAPAGYQTPAKAYGADLILEIEGVTRT